FAMSASPSTGYHTPSLHDALPIFGVTEDHCMPTNTEVEEEIRIFHEIYNSEDQPEALKQLRADALVVMQMLERFNPHLTGAVLEDRKSTRLNSSHVKISYAVFCLK